jgi:hypothetical protein
VNAERYGFLDDVLAQLVVGHLIEGIDAAVLVAIDKERQLRRLPEQLKSLVGRRRISISDLYLDDIIGLCRPRAQLDAP